MIVNPQENAVGKAVYDALADGGVGRDAKPVKPVEEVLGLLDGIRVVVDHIEHCLSQGVIQSYLERISKSLAGEGDAGIKAEAGGAQGIGVDIEAAVAIESPLVDGFVQLVQICDLVDLIVHRDRGVTIMGIAFFEQHDQADGVIAVELVDSGETSRQAHLQKGPGVYITKIGIGVGANLEVARACCG